MAKSDITGKRKMSAQNVSHSNIKTKRKVAALFKASA